jgi:preprotein translocase subunit SecG
MSTLMGLVVVIQIVSALGMIGLVLLQQGKGADMGASFGSGASGTLFGATGSANVLSRSTAVLATVFFICTLALALISGKRMGASEPASVLDKPQAASAAAQPASGAAAIPTTLPVVAPASSAASAP